MCASLSRDSLERLQLHGRALQGPRGAGGRAQTSELRRQGADGDAESEPDAQPDRFFVSKTCVISEGKTPELVHGVNAIFHESLRG